MTLAVLEREAKELLRPGSLQEGFTEPLYGLLLGPWRAWQRGIVPASRGGGYGAQNPRLLRAFEALDRAEAAARE